MIFSAFIHQPLFQSNNILFITLLLFTDELLATDEDFTDAPLDLSDLYEDQYLNPSQGHRVFIIHPGVVLERWTERQQSCIYH